MFAEHQNEIYARGAAGETPTFPIILEELERAAQRVLTPEAYGYIAGAAGSESTLHRNRAALEAWEILPRMLRDVSQRDLEVTLFGKTHPAPLLLAPIGVQSIAHPEGELPVARAARTLKLPFIHSTAATQSPEAVAEANGDATRWFQLYWPKDPEITASFLNRAEKAGYSAVVVTLDTRLLAWRERDLNAAYLPFLRGEGIGIYLSDPVFRSRLSKPPEEDLPAAIAHWAAGFSDVSQTWEDLASLRRLTRLPILLKGILHPDDARQAVDCGVDGLIVSNHGGRQLDGSVGALDALPAIVEQINGQLPVLFDSGIRRGADVFKALALGAVAVLVGRPYMWGLAVGGEAGVVEVLRRLCADLDLTMALAGCPRIQDLNPDWLRGPHGGPRSTA